MADLVRVARAFVRLRYRLLRGAIRHGGAEQVGAVLSIVVAVMIGVIVGGLLALVAAGTDQLVELTTVACAVILLASLGFGVVAGVAQPIDPRVLAAEPLTEREQTVGLLATSAFGPPGIGGLLVGVGLVAGASRGAASLPIVAVAVVAWLISLLLVARTTTNLLAVLTTRFPRAGQFVVALAGLVFYGLLQLMPATLVGLDRAERTELSAILAWTPPGQLGRAMGVAAEAPATALLHLVLGAAWLPVLALALAQSSRRLTESVRLDSGRPATDPATTALGGLVRRACGSDPAGAIAWRTLLTRFRTPRTVLETFIGAGLGLAAVLVPTLLRDARGSGAVLVGGAVQLAVLFFAGNSFGIDGPALTNEILAGAGRRVLVRGKARAIVIVGMPLAVLGPLVAAGVTGEGEYLPAGIAVGIGGVLGGTGAAVVQSALVPIAIPDSDNPFSSGESGQGLVAGLLLAAVLTVLAIVTLPVALGLLWATERGGVGIVTSVGLVAIGAGWLVLRAAIAIAEWRLDGRLPEFVAAVTPAH